MNFYQAIRFIEKPYSLCPATSYRNLTTYFKSDANKGFWGGMLELLRYRYVGFVANAFREVLSYQLINLGPFCS